MSDLPAGSSVLLGHLPEPVRARTRDPEALAAALASALEAARAAWPGIDLAAEQLVPFLARRLPAHEAPEVALRELRVADLYVICAHLHGDRRATAALVATHLARIRPLLGRMRIRAAEIDDLEQTIRLRLLVGDESREPAIASYAGRGDFGHWLGVVVGHEAGLVMRRSGKELPVEPEELLELAVADTDHELAYLKGLYRTEFREAFREALASLSAQDRNVLRFTVARRMTADNIAALYRVHRVTAARWLGQIREKLVMRTHKALQRRLRIDGAEMESILRLIRSQLDVSVLRLLGEHEDEGAGV